MDYQNLNPKLESNFAIKRIIVALILILTSGISFDLALNHIVTNSFLPSIVLNVEYKRTINDRVLSTSRGKTIQENNSDTDRYITYIIFENDYSDLIEGESIETDTCLSMFNDIPKQTSGEEIACLHHNYVFSKVKTINQSLNFRNALIFWPKDSKVMCSSTSLLLPNQINKNDSRYKDGFTNLKCLIGYIDANPSEIKNISLRSPTFDRITTISKDQKVSPYTTYRNEMNVDIQVLKLILFEANITSKVDSNTSVIIEVNKTKIMSKDFYDHKKEITSVANPVSIDLNINLAKNDEIKIYCVTDPDAPIVNDCVSFIIASNTLVPVEETNYLLDVNGDNICDFISIDNTKQIYLAYGIGNGQGFVSQITWESYYSYPFILASYSETCTK